MICTRDTLTRALIAYNYYKPTASNHLQQCRDKWIPVHVKSAVDRSRVRSCAEAVLNGKPYKAQYKALRTEHKIAVALCMMHGWSEILWIMDEKERPVVHNYTDRVFTFLNEVHIDHATLAVRNWCSSRDDKNGVSFSIFNKHRLTDVRALMTVYVKIRRHWDKVGFDWNRRNG